MNVCVIGGRGYVGTAVTAALRDRDHDVTTMDPHMGGDHHISLDILDEHLQDHLEGFDAVVNLVGLSPMKQPGIPGYRDLHVAGAENVVGACETNSVDRLVHMSALGADPDAAMEFLETKGLGEEAVLESGLDVTVFRPSMIFDHGNELIEYAKLFAPLRVFPHIPTQVQPIYRGDVAELFAAAVEDEVTEDVLEIGGPDTMTLFTFVKGVYHATGRSCHPLPVLPLMKLGLSVMEHVPFVPFGRDQKRFLTFDNTTERNAAPDYVELTAYDAWLENAFNGT